MDVELKYAGYLEREKSAALRLQGMDGFLLPMDMEYASIGTVSYEAREKLLRVRPRSLGQARRIPGVSPSDLQNLVLAVLRRERVQ